MILGMQQSRQGESVMATEISILQNAAKSVKGCILTQKRVKSTLNSRNVTAIPFRIILIQADTNTYTRNTPSASAIPQGEKSPIRELRTELIKK